MPDPRKTPDIITFEEFLNTFILRKKTEKKQNANFKTKLAIEALKEREKKFSGRICGLEVEVNLTSY